MIDRLRDAVALVLILAFSSLVGTGLMVAGDVILYFLFGAELLPYSDNPFFHVVSRAVVGALVVLGIVGLVRFAFHREPVRIGEDD